MSDSRYAVEDILNNFDALLHDVDFSKELRLLGIGAFNILQRKQMLLELYGIYMGLWSLALRRSFPHDEHEIFRAFMERHAQRHPDRRSAQLRQRGQQYRDLLLSAGDQDFTVVSRHLLTFTQRDDATVKALSLRMALLLRATYTFIFERLI